MIISPSWKMPADAGIASYADDVSEIKQCLSVHFTLDTLFFSHGEWALTIAPAISAAPENGLGTPGYHGNIQ